MRVLVQRSAYASCTIDKKIHSEINSGLVIFVGFTHSDDEKLLDYMVNKVLNLRIFDDENGVMNKSILDVGGEILSISQFTLQADTRKGHRPSYINAMKGEDANKIYEYFNSKLNEQIKTYPGVFGADMLVSIENDGPITIIIDTKEKKD
jgi:D-tyrosyl-tRNA(Tyr) deacylase